MLRILPLAAALAAAIPLANAGDAPSCPAFRGADGSGSFPTAKPPTEWNEKAGKNIRWKKELALAGWASPIVTGGKVIALGADAENRAVYAFDAATGKEAWTCDVPKDDKAQNAYAPDTLDEGWNVRVHAGSTPATNGTIVAALFSSCQLVGITVADGSVAWSQVIGDNGGNTYGQCGSLALYKNSVIVSFEGGEQFLARYDLASGKQLWKAARKGSTWASPMVITTGGKTLAVIGAEPTFLAVDAETGAKAWAGDVVKDGVEYAYGPGSVQAGGILALAGERCGLIGLDAATGKETWTFKSESIEKYSDGPSLLSDGTNVFHFYQSMLVAVGAKDGKLVKEQDIGESSSYASPVLAGGNLYLTCGSTVVVVPADAAKGFAPVGKGVISDSCEATPAVAGDAIYLRGDKTLYAIGAK